MKLISQDILNYCNEHSYKDSKLLIELIEYTYEIEDVPQMI